MAKSRTKTKAKPKNKRTTKNSNKKCSKKSKQTNSDKINENINVRRSKRNNPVKHDLEEESKENTNEEVTENADEVQIKEDEEIEFNDEMEVKNEIVIDDDGETVVKDENGDKLLPLESSPYDECVTTELNSSKVELQDRKTENLKESQNMDTEENEEEILAREIMEMKCFPDLQEFIYKESIKGIGCISSFHINQLGDNRVIEDNQPIQENNIQEMHNHEEIKTLESEEIINCTCGYKEEDGLMIQCDICLTWQHALCTGINTQAQIPDNYTCIYCIESTNVTYSQKFAYAKYLLTVGKLPSFSKRTIDSKTQSQRRRLLIDSFKLRTELRNIENMDRTLRTKLSIAEKSDHPKLYMWSANWDTTDDEKQEPKHGPVGEKPIESLDCRLRLLDKIENDQREVSYRLTLIHDMIDRLESDLYERSVEEKNVTCVARQIAKDLKTVSTAVAIS